MIATDIYLAMDKLTDFASVFASAVIIQADENCWVARNGNCSLFNTFRFVFPQAIPICSVILSVLKTWWICGRRGSCVILEHRKQSFALEDWYRVQSSTSLLKSGVGCIAQGRESGCLPSESLNVVMRISGLKTVAVKLTTYGKGYRRWVHCKSNLAVKMMICI